MPATDVDLTLAYRSAPDVVMREIGGECLLVPVRGRLAELRNLFTLTPTAAFVWRLLDGTRTLEAVVDDAVRLFEASREEVENDVRAFVALLLDAGLAEPVP